MLKKHAQFFKSLFFIFDLIILSLAWVFSYMIHFYTKPTWSSLPEISDYWLHLKILPLLLILWAVFSKKSKLYRPRRMGHWFKESFEVGKCLTFTIILLVSIVYFLRYFELSRFVFLYFWILGMGGLLIQRFIIRAILKKMRERGYNLRFALIAGTGALAEKILEKLEMSPEYGIRVIGFLSQEKKEVGKTIREIPIIGCYEEGENIIRDRGVDIFFIALSASEYIFFEKLVQKVLGKLPEVKVVPASYEFLGLRGGIDEIEGLPLISLQGSPLFGWDRFFKRIFDLFFGSLILIFVLPLMILLSLLIKLTTKGPILYKQERIGMDGRKFQMLKFRTMNVDAEKETGPIWTKENDPRRTKIGAFLRKTSLDELPQLFNVLKGEMSLVGPRPERPYFVEEFRKRIPSYMLRHKIKAGMTGWAQVNGWRGNTSIEKRIEHDLYYIENWSIGFDLKILLMTLWKGFFSKSAY